MSIGPDSEPPLREDLSALADGELDAASAALVCAAWRESPQVRSAWHAYQLIGDVLRSEDLASTPAHDAAFLAELRIRLDAEPVVLAPETPPPAAIEPQPQRALANGRSSRWSWMAPSAVAAGFVLVAGALLVTRGPTPGAAQPAATLAANSAPPAIAVPATVPALAPQARSGAESLTEPVAAESLGTVLRDARLQRYLAAHEQFAGTSALGVPSSFLRNAAAEAPNR